LVGVGMMTSGDGVTVPQAATKGTAAVDSIPPALACRGAGPHHRLDARDELPRLGRRASIRVLLFKPSAPSPAMGRL